MPAFDLNEFFKLSSVLHYNLSAASLNRYTVMTYLLAGKRLDADERRDRDKKSLVMDALGYLFSAYSHKRRRLGPMAVLHPLRAAALLSRAGEVPDLEKLLTVLFHDILEDVKPVDFDAREWKDMEGRLFDLLAHMSPEAESRLMQRLKSLTRTKSETYYRYIGRMLESSAAFPDVVEVKLADRLDNTLDMRIDLEDPLTGVDCFMSIFQLLFVPTYPGHAPPTDHQPATAMNGARRLHQLFKNSVLLSLIRQLAPAAETPVRKVLFEAVAHASLREAERTLMHLIGYHLKDRERQRQLLVDAMDYSHSGRSDLVTRPDGSRLLDGLFSTYFAPADGRVLKQQLDSLYQNKPLMLQACIAFIVIFLGFLNNPRYYVRGISAEGIEAS
ncbi:MAG TPA: hypothetical protein VLH81_05810 [Desulfobacterales bacterium]|nr:hypothetical protein [Desulfobacterales bacterium]